MRNLLFLSLSLTTLLFARDVSLLEPSAETEIAWGEGKSRQTLPDMVVADLDEMHTRIIYPRAGLIPPKPKGIFYLYAGTSGRCDSEYGITRSLGPLANELRKRGFAVMAFQPPIYHKAHSETERQPFVERYSSLDSNLSWFLSTLEFGEGKLRKAGIDPKSIGQYVIARSTFAAVVSQAIHQLTLGQAEFEPVSRLRKVTIMGLDGHSPEEIATWHSAERKFYFEEHPEKGDPPVVLAAPSIFKDMTHQSERVEKPVDLPTPEVIFTLGSRDEFAYGNVHELFPPIAGFIRNHPHIRTTLAWHNGYHDLSREVRIRRAGEPKDLILSRTMANTKLLLDYKFAPDDPNEVRPHHRVIYLPDEASVIEPLADGIESKCREQISLLAAR